jgi:hypothetical protein
MGREQISESGRLRGDCPAAATIQLSKNARANPMPCRA